MAIVYKDGKPVVVSKRDGEGGEGGGGGGDDLQTPPPNPENIELTRRRFMRSSLLGSLAAFTIGGAGTTYLFLYPKKVGTFGSVVTAGDVSQFPEGTVTRVPDGRFYLVHTRKEDDGGEGFIALYWKCVHLGCVVPWKPDEDGTFKGKTYKGIFHCQCHGSLYLMNGQNFGGPAPRPLDIMKVTINGTKVQVDTGKISKREAFEPSQIAKL